MQVSAALTRFLVVAGHHACHTGERLRCVQEAGPIHLAAGLVVRPVMLPACSPG